MEKRTFKIPVWIIYSLVFAVVVAATFGLLRFEGLTNIWRVDGIAQHYPILKEFYGILHGTVHQSLFSWSWNLGLGADQMTSFAYYVVGDPFAYLIALFPADKIELGYQLLTIVRLYAVGLSFLALARQLRFKRAGSLLGALIYTFNGFTFYVSFHHPFFLLAPFFFPLLCLGVDKIYKGKSFLWLTGFTAMVFICNLYFAYLLGLGALVFAAARYVDLKRRGELVRSFPRSLGYFAVTIALALAVAAVILLPTLLAMLSSSRTGSSTFANGLKLYPLVYYLNLPNALFNTTGTMYYWDVIGTGALSFVALVWSFRHFKQYLALNVTFILIVLGVLVPAFAAFMNVMSTPSNRWLLLVSMPFALAVAHFTDHVSELTTKDFKWFIIATIGLLVMVFVGNGFTFLLRQSHYLNYGCLFIFMVILSYGYMRSMNGLPFKTMLLAIVGLNAISIGTSFYSTNFNVSVSYNEIPTGSATSWAKNFFDGADKFLKKYDKTFYRTSMMSNYDILNTAGNNIPMLLGTHTIESYFSVQNGAVNSFNKQLDNNQQTMNDPTSDANNRTTMLNLLGVKYVFARRDDVALRKSFPYGFKLVRDKNGKMVKFSNRTVYKLENHSSTVLLKNKNALPLAYMQTTQLNSNSYKKLAGNDKEQALLTGAKVNKKVSGVKTTRAKSASKNVSYTVKSLSEPITTLAQLIRYRLTNNSDLRVANLDLNKYSDAQVVKEFAKSAKLGTISKRVNKLLTENQNMVTENAEENKNGLKVLRSDVSGNHQAYQLQIKNPQKYQNCELYLQIKGIKINQTTTQSKLTQLTNRMTLLDEPSTPSLKVTHWRYVLTHPSLGGYLVSMNTATSSNNLVQLGYGNMSDYEKKNGATINLGYSSRKVARRIINIRFTGEDGISFKSVKLVAVPFNKQYETKIHKLQKQGLKKLKVTNNTVSGVSTTKQNAILTTSIPYSTGWHLTVDGKVTPTQKVNTGFVGAKVTGGTHRIKLTYETPGLAVGKWLTRIGSFVFIVIFLVEGTLLILRRRPKPDTRSHRH
ncbi:YfhO family protein [Secundilactobacillus collinoides]|uniref:Integral membrane protein n=2 Tax=Secundilactobacillus collinoides TaxID=33960 RepID=A0A0R2BIA4_SECCO|nr:YfhO family protein [Secundilactobacillus collinoides]KRM77332.1 integral membrane protein [Secundilactobacillus collinoides DSM 20515 = JCM 1123]KZL41166.1 hypothetical protein TY91_08020 [Secundilactobacillus collinoides]